MPAMKVRVGERGVVAEEGEASSLVGSEELAQEQSPEQARETSYRQKEPQAARRPARVIKGDAAARHDHVHVRMMRHRRAPGVEHGCDADPRAKPLGIGCRDFRHGCLRVLEHRKPQKRRRAELNADTTTNSRIALASYGSGRLKWRAGCDARPDSVAYWPLRPIIS